MIEFNQSRTSEAAAGRLVQQICIAFRRKTGKGASVNDYTLFEITNENPTGRIHPVIVRLTDGRFDHNTAQEFLDSIAETLTVYGLDLGTLGKGKHITTYEGERFLLEYQLNDATSDEVTHWPGLAATRILPGRIAVAAWYDERPHVPAIGEEFELTFDGNPSDPIEFLKIKGYCDAEKWKVLGPLVAGPQTKKCKILALENWKTHQDIKDQLPASTLLAESEWWTPFQEKYRCYQEDEHGSPAICFGGSIWIPPHGKDCIAMLSHGTANKWRATVNPVTPGKQNVWVVKMN